MTQIYIYLLVVAMIISIKLLLDLAHKYGILQKIVQFHIREHTARWQYHQICLLFNNIHWIKYNLNACVKDIIRLMACSHVKYNGSVCVQDKIAFWYVHTWNIWQYNCTRQDT